MPAELDRLLDQAAQALDTDANDVARRLILDALRRATDSGHKAQVVRASMLAATLAYRDEDYTLATQRMAAAQALVAELDDALLSARVAATSALVSWSVGDFDTALVELESALPAARASDDAELRFHTANRLGGVYGSLGNPEAAIVWHERALQTAIGLPTRRQEALALGNLGARHLELGEQHHDAGRQPEAVAAYKHAVVYTRQAMDIARGAGLATVLEIFMPNLGAALARLGRSDEALAVLQQHWVLARKAGESLSLLYSSTAMARIHLERGDLAAARQAVQQGLALGTGRGSINALDSLYEVASQVEERAGDFAQALAHHKQFHALRTSLATQKAELRAKVLAVRLQTEHARAEAHQAQLRASELMRSNEELLERTRLLSHEALVDPLTGLANRRHLDAELARLHAVARTAGTPLCAGWLDIDHFKRVNDTHTHAVGDAVLRRVGAILLATCRSGDLAARCGGEEFLIALPGIDMAQAQRVCERLRASVQTQDWDAIAKGLRVTASVGLCDLAVWQDLKQGLDAADKLLYAAKAAGRNRVHSEG